MSFNPQSKYRDASFGDCVFDIVTTNDQFGHRVAVHEYPERDIPWSERLGRKARVFRVRAAIRGENHGALGLGLIDKAECGVVERLVHPIYGEHDCILVQCIATNDPCGRAGETIFDLQFIEAGDFTFPDVGTVQGQASASGAVDFANTVFTTTVFPFSGPNDTGLFSFILNLSLELRSLFNQHISWDSLTIDLADELDQMAANPEQYTGDNYADIIRQVIEGIYTNSKDDAAALAALCSLFDFGVNRTAPESTYALYVRLMALQYGALSALQAGYTNPVEAISFMECLIGHLERDSLVAAELCLDQIYGQIMCLISAASADFRFIALGLPPILTRQLCDSLPLVVAAFEVFGNLDTMDAFAELNGQRNCIFMPSEVFYQAQR